MQDTSDDGRIMTGKEKEHYLFLRKSFADFNEAAVRMQSAFSNLERKFADINRQLEWKNAELEKVIAEKEEVRSYLQNILESLTTGVIVTDLKDKITILNRAAAVFLGIQPDRAVGKNVKSLLPEAAVRQWKAISGARLAAAGKKIRIGDRLIEFFGAPVAGPGADGTTAVIGTVYILRDVTRIEKLEEMAKRTEKFDAMGELAANIAHEIRNPLGSIELFSSLMLKDAQRPADRERLRQIISSVKNVDGKIANLLLFTRRRDPLYKRINLHRILREVLHFSGQLIERGGICLSIDYARSDPYITGDPEMLKQVFLNILLNALQAMPDGGNLEIRTIVRDVDVEIRFADSGEGVQRENLRKLFEPFFSTREKGSGLGLAIAHTIIDIHEGSIDVESSGRGAVFSIVLPLIRGKTKIKNGRRGSAETQVGG
jgi:PAS domain S-box-containing protein